MAHRLLFGVDFFRLLSYCDSLLYFLQRVLFSYAHPGFMWHTDYFWGGSRSAFVVLWFPPLLSTARVVSLCTNGIYVAHRLLFGADFIRLAISVLCVR